MSNSFYNHSTYPTPNAPGSSANMRAELDLITAGFNKLPTLSGNGYKVAMINSAGTALVASSDLQSLAITSSTLDSTPIGATTRAAGNFTTLSANSTVNLGTSVTIGGGTINNTQIGNTTPSSAAFTTASASSGFTGNLTGNVTGNLTGNVTGNVTGDLTGNVTAASGTSTFNSVTINGTLDMNAGTVGTITGLATPTNASDAANKSYVDTQDALKLSLTGGTMSGNIAMGSSLVTGLGAPSSSGDATRKSYVDAADALKLDLAGGTMSGAIAMGSNKITGLGTPTSSADATTKTYVDTADALKLNLSGGTMSGALAMGGNKVTGLGTPTADGDAATKAYVDGVAQGLDVKASVRAATTANITLSGAQTIDGVSVVAGDRVLVKDQNAPANNGIYVVASGSWTRSNDADAWAELPGAFVFVEDGTVNDNSGWVCTVTPGGTIGSTSITFEQFSGAGQITAGAGLTKSGNTLDVGTASASRIVVNADNIDLATTGISAGTYRSLTIDAYGRATAGTNPTTLSGYGITDAYTKTETDTALALKLNLSGGTMSGAIAMGTSKITGLGDPTSAQDAATKTYVDTADALKLNLSGGTMSGAIAMGSNKITGLGTPTASGDATTKSYVDTQRDTRLALAGGTMSGAIAMGTNKITGMGDPTNAQDAVTLNYVTTLYGSTASAAASASAAAASALDAGNYATAASGSASAALTSANNAAASYDSFDDRYLGSKTSDPTVDNDGNALLTGALYWNSSLGQMKVYDGAAWQIAYVPSSTYLPLSGGTLTGGLSGTTLTMSGNITVSGGTANGVAYLNGSKVLTTGSALTFDGTTLNFGSTGQRITGDMSNATQLNRLFFQNSIANSNTSIGVMPNGTATSARVNVFNSSAPDNAAYLQLAVDGGAAYLQSSATGSGTALPMSFIAGGSTRYQIQTSGESVWSIGSEQMRLTSTGLGIGTSSPNYAIDVQRSGTPARIGMTAAGSGLSPDLVFNRARGTLASPTVANGSAGLGNIYFYGYDGSSYVLSSQIAATQEGTISTGVLQSSLRFFNADSAGVMQERMRLDSSGNLGLGVTPSAWMLPTIETQSQMSFGTFGVGRNVYYATGYASKYIANGYASRYSQSSGQHIWETAGNNVSGAGAALTFTQAMTLDASGRLMIGTTSPQQQLTVSGAGTNDGGLYFNTTLQNATTAATSAPKTGICFQAFYSGTSSLANFAGISGGKENTTDGNASGVLIFSTATSGSSPAERARITSAGVFQLENDQLIKNGKGIALYNSDNTGYYSLYNNAGVLTVSNGSGRMYLDADGNLLVGKAADSTTTNGVKATPGDGTTAHIFIANTTSTSAAPCLYLNRQGGTGATVHFRQANTLVGSISVDASSTAYNTSSDYRLKDNQQLLTGSGAFIDALRPKTWDWKSGGKGVGFIAHEVQEVSPSTVVGEKDAVDAEGNPIMQAMEYGSAEFIANIVAELQSLRARVAALEAK